MYKLFSSEFGCNEGDSCELNTGLNDGHAVCVTHVTQEESRTMYSLSHLTDHQVTFSRLTRSLHTQVELVKNDLLRISG